MITRKILIFKKYLLIILLTSSIILSVTGCAQEEKSKLFVFCNDALYSLSINEQLQIEKTKITDPVIEVDKGIKTKYFDFGLGAPFFFSSHLISCCQKKVIFRCREEKLPYPIPSSPISIETFTVMANIDGSEKRLLKGEKDDDFRAWFAKEEEKYYYLIVRKKFDETNKTTKYETQLWRANYDDSGKENLIKNKGLLLIPICSPYWEWGFGPIIESPNGGNILFFFSKDNLDPYIHPDLWIMNINSREKRNITEEMKNYLDDKETCIFETLFTYDGKKIIMFVAYTDKFEIWSMNIDGSDKKNLTRNLIMDKELLHPFFLLSPDNKILFTKIPNYENINEDEYFEGLNLDIWIMNLDGTDVKKLTEGELKFKFPILPLLSDENIFTTRTIGFGLFPGFIKFSPDGKKIVFLGKDKNGYSLWIMNSDGSEKKDIGEKIREKFSKDLSKEDLPRLFRECWFPTFSPDGKYIFFLLPDIETWEEENFENWRYSLWIINQDGSEINNLSELYDLNIVTDFRWYFLPVFPD